MLFKVFVQLLVGCLEAKPQDFRDALTFTCIYNSVGGPFAVTRTDIGRRQVHIAQLRRQIAQLGRVLCTTLLKLLFGWLLLLNLVVTEAAMNLLRRMNTRMVVKADYTRIGAVLARLT